MYFMMIAVRKKALEKIECAQDDKKHCKDKTQYKVGASVLVQNCKKLSRKGSKLEHNWTGQAASSEVQHGTFEAVLST